MVFFEGVDWMFLVCGVGRGELTVEMVFFLLGSKVLILICNES